MINDNTHDVGGDYVNLLVINFLSKAIFWFSLFQRWRISKHKNNIIILANLTLTLIKCKSYIKHVQIYQYIQILQYRHITDSTFEGH